MAFTSSSSSILFSHSVSLRSVFLMISRNYIYVHMNSILKLFAHSTGIAQHTTVTTQTHSFPEYMRFVLFVQYTHTLGPVNLFHFCAVEYGLGSVLS